MTVFLLTGDIGGTNARMSLYKVDRSLSANEPLFVKYFRNAEHLPESVLNDDQAFENFIVVPFLRQAWDSLNELGRLEEAEIIACLATAGLVMNNRVRMTNLGYLLVDGTAIQSNNTDPYLKQIVLCQVINDFVAQGYGCLTLQPDEIRQLSGPPDAKLQLGSLRGPKVCVGAGTGLGECYLTPYPDDPELYSCFPSEGGHVEYAPTGEIEVQLWHALRQKFGGNRISVERVVSGKGLANVYEFLAQLFPNKVDKVLHSEFLQAGDEQGKVVGINASTPGSLFRHAMHIMMNAYGCEVGSAAIKWIPTGGLFVTGGLTPKNIQFIEGADSEFMKAYQNKGRVSPLLEKIPLFAVMVEDLGVRGALKAAQNMYEQHCKQERKASIQERNVIMAVAAAAGFALGMLVHRIRSSKV